MTEEITGLIGEWSSKLKKERETGESSLRQELTQVKKLSTDSVIEIKQITEEIKNKSKQKVA